jgi:DNA recombination protein RmuC
MRVNNIYCQTDEAGCIVLVLFYNSTMSVSILIALLFACLALVLGVALGWLAWGRSAAQQSRQLTALASEIEALEDETRQLDKELSAQTVRAEHLPQVEAERDDLRAQAIEARQSLAMLNAQQRERDRAFAEQVSQLDLMKGELTRLFEASAGQALSRSQEAFFQIANETFGQHRTQAGQQLSGLIGPVTEQLQRAEAKIEALEKSRQEAYGSLTEQIRAMRVGQEQVRAEAAKLSSALRSSSKLRGSWGEQQLRNVLEMAGLSPYADFRTEVSVDGEDGKLRPDVVVRMPGGRQLVIDAKTSLAAFQMALETDDDGERRAHLIAHARSMKDHASALSRKKYQDQFEQTPDFVVMFVPGEHFLSAAMETDPGLWEFAFDQRILIATPINLIALAKTVAQLWRQEKMADTAKEIAALARELYRRLIRLGDHVEGVGKSLDRTVRAYNGFVGSLETSVLPQARKFSELDVEGSETALPLTETVETAVRLPVAGRDLKLVAAKED